VRRQRDFSIGVARLLDRIESRSQFLKHIVETGGTVDMIVHLPGSVNMGAVIRHPDLQRIAALSMNLGFEVFPDYQAAISK
jgi:hypothetical protein